MIGMTNARGGGGGLNPKIVGGTAQPLNPKDNLIWIKTDISFDRYAFTNVYPETIEDGTVWIETSEKDGVEINIGKKNTVLLHIMSARVYSGGNWKICEGYAYISGVWEQFSFLQKTLYKDGVFGREAYRDNVLNGTVAYDTDGIKLTTKGNSISETYVQFGPLTIAGFNSIEMSIQNVSTASANNMNTAIFLSKQSTSMRDDAESISEFEVATGDKTVKTVSLDVSNTKGDGFYVNVGLNTFGNKWTNSRIYKVLEVVFK